MGRRTPPCTPPTDLFTPEMCTPPISSSLMHQLLAMGYTNRDRGGPPPSRRESPPLYLGEGGGEGRSTNPPRPTATLHPQGEVGGQTTTATVMSTPITPEGWWGWTRRRGSISRVRMRGGGGPSCPPPIRGGDWAITSSPSRPTSRRSTRTACDPGGGLTRIMLRSLDRPIEGGAVPMWVAIQGTGEVDRCL